MKDLSLLEQRKIEAKILAPIIEAFEAEFGRKRTRALVGEVIKKIAHRHGEAIREELDGPPMEKVAALLPRFNEADALEIDVLKQDDSCLEFNVTRCRYAEMYRELGMQDLGFIVSCGRDFNFPAGFNKNMKLTRTQTIMKGASHCDFRYEMVEEGQV